MTTRSKTRSNDEALSAFIAAKAEIDTMLERLTALSADHFAFDPEAINWGAVGSLNTVAADLRKITDFLFGEGEHAA